MNIYLEENPNDTEIQTVVDGVIEYGMQITGIRVMAVLFINPSSKKREPPTAVASGCILLTKAPCPFTENSDTFKKAVLKTT